MKEQVFTTFMSFLSNIQYYHWQTASHSRHEASGELYEEMVGKIDEFMEIFIAKYGKLSSKTFSLEVNALTSKTVFTYLNKMLKFLNHLGAELNPEHDSDLLNIKDEMKGLISRTIYKFRQYA